MTTKDKKFDTYIEGSADFAKPVLTHLRQLVHTACPEVEEVFKWGFPCFDYKGPFCSMAAFKEHCSFGFWKAAIMKDAENLKTNQATAMGHLGKIKSLNDLPADKILTAYIKEAKRLNDEGIKLPPRKKQNVASALIIPDYFSRALSKNKNAQKVFEAFSSSHKKEYVQWIIEAKTENTKNKRLVKAVEQMAEGKSLNWKYAREPHPNP